MSNFRRFCCCPLSFYSTVETGHFMAIYSGVTLPEERTGGPAHHTLRGSSSSGGTRGRGRGESEGAPGRNSEAADKAAKLLASQKAFKAHAFTARRAEAFKAEAMKEVQKTGDEHRHYQQDSWLALRHKVCDTCGSSFVGCPRHREMIT